MGHITEPYQRLTIMWGATRGMCKAAYNKRRMPVQKPLRELSTR